MKVHKRVNSFIVKCQYCFSTCILKFPDFSRASDDKILKNVDSLSDISGIWIHFSWCLWGRVKICGLHITQDLVFIVRKAAEEESQAYFHNGSGPAKAVGPAEHIDSCHFNFTGELYWVNDQAHDGEHSSNKKQASNPSYEVEPKRINSKRYDGQSKTDDEE